MVRLILEGIWIDLNDQEFELKWKHPIQNSLKGESSTYSTDITALLTQNNRSASDYKIFTESIKTNKYLYGVLYVNNTSMPVRAYIKAFTATSIKFYLEQFRTGGVSLLLKDDTFICDLHKSEIQKEIKKDLLLNVQDGSLVNFDYIPGSTIDNIFEVVAEDYIDANGANQTRPTIRATGLIQNLATFYGCTLVNAPTNYYVYSNQWKIKNNIGYKGRFDHYLRTIPSTDTVQVQPLITQPEYNLCIASTKIVSVGSFRIHFFVSELSFPQPAGESGPDMICSLILRNDSTLIEYTVGSIPYSFGETVQSLMLTSNQIPSGTYSLIVSSNYAVEIQESNFQLESYYVESEIASSDFDDYADFQIAGYYPCWQNLPKVTAKNLIETIALCAGKMVEYKDNVINFIDLNSVFSWENAIDVSDSFISMTDKSFQFLTSNNATVTYADGTVIATVKINDETLPDDTNNIAVIDAIRVQDDNKVERVKDKVILQQVPDGHFEIINKLADIYQPVVKPKIFNADFIYFADNKKPLLVRQLGGIFISLESVMTTKNTISLKLLKLR